MAENPKEESDTDDERARRMSDFLRDPDINVKWTDYNLAKNRLARGKGKGKIVRPNSPLESPRNSPASEPPSIPGTSRPSRPSPVRPPTRSASPRSHTRSGVDPGPLPQDHRLQELELLLLTLTAGVNLGAPLLHKSLSETVFKTDLSKRSEPGVIALLLSLRLTRGLG